MARWNRLPKYFLHGLVWSIVFSFVVLTLIFMLAGLVFTGLLLVLILLGLGFILGFALLFLILGAANSAITNLVWKIDTKEDLKGNFIHGLGLFIALTAVHVPTILIEQFAPGLITVITLLIGYCFIDGFIAKNLATSGPGQKAVQDKKQRSPRRAPTPRQRAKPRRRISNRTHQFSETT